MRGDVRGFRLEGRCRAAHACSLGILEPVSEDRKADRGGGVHVRRGGLRLRNLSLTFDRSTGDLVDTSMITELRLDVFPDWLDIAKRAAADAETARATAVEAAEDDDAFNSAIGDEFRTSTVAVAAAAFAIDAFYGSVLQHAPTTKVKAKSREASIFETLKRAFSMTQAQQEQARENLRLLFKLRDNAVHPPADWAEPIKHPAFNLGMEPRLVHFRAENALNAQAFARNLISYCLRSPRPTLKDLADWCKGLQDQVPQSPPVPDWARSSG